MQNLFLKTAVLFLLPSFAMAFRLSPMVIEFSPTGSRATQVLTLENPGSEKIPVQIEAFTRTVDDKGVEVRKKTDDFTIYPEQIVLMPNEKRNVRLTWSAENIGKEEKAYRIVASQLPVEFKEKNSQPKGTGVSLNFLLQYVASAYVKPEGAQADVKISEVKKNKDGKLAIKLENSGTAHKFVKPKSVKILANGKVVQDVSSLKEFEINLLPKKSQVVLIEAKKDLPTQGLKGQIELLETED